MAPSTTFPILGLDDLVQFRQGVTDNNLALQLSPALNGVKFDMSTWSPEAQVGTSFGKAFLAAALGQYGRGQVADQTRLAAAALPALANDPMNAVAPEGIDSAAFDALRTAAAIKKLQRQELLKQSWAEMLQEAEKAGILEEAKAQYGAKYAGIESRNRKLGELGALQEMSGTGIEDVAGNELYTAKQDKIKNLDDIRKEFNLRTGEFGTVLSAAKSLSGALKDGSKVTDSELAKYAVQMIEPGLATNQGETDAIINSQSIPEQFKATLLGALDGTTQLGPDARAGIARLAARAYSSKKGNYDKALGYYQGLAEERSLLKPGKSISFLGEAPDVNDIFGEIPAAPPVPPSGGSSQSGTLAIEQQYRALRAQGLSQQEAGAKLGLK